MTRTSLVLRRTTTAALGVAFGLLAFVAPLAHAGDKPHLGELPDTQPRTGSGQSLAAFYSITGRVSYSVDAAGSNSALHAVKVNKPNDDAEVIRAFLLAAGTPGGGVIPDGGVRLNGGWVAWDDMVPGPFQNNYIADVTPIVKPAVDSRAAGMINVLVSEPYGTYKVDGEILVVVFDDPQVQHVSTVALFFGAQALAGDTFSVTLQEPIDPAEPSARADMGLGISWSTGGTQSSLIDVQGQRMSSSAGGYDDGSFANGAFITAGGYGDSVSNPADPHAQGGSDYDDELYSLLPFIDAATQQIDVFTLNPSNDDNIFFAHFYFSTEAIFQQRLMLTPLTAQTGVGMTHTVDAHVQDFFGNPQPNTVVTFEVVDGPNAGTTGSGVADGNGDTSWSYVGVGGEGIDRIRASYLDDEGEPVYSNTVTNEWFVIQLPPVCDAGGPYDGWVNTPLALDASGSSDPNEDIIAFEWDLDGDGVYDDATGVLVNHTWSHPGTYAVGLQVRDAVGHASTCTAAVQIGNHDPVAEPGGPYSGAPQSTITLDGTGSYDVDPGDTLTFAWDLDNDGQFDDSTSPTPQFTIGNVPPGTSYTVCLRVTDSFGAAHSACTSVSTANQGPVCDAGGPYAAECGGATTEIPLDGTASFDPDPGDQLAFAWSCSRAGAVFIPGPTAPDPILVLPGGATCTDTAQVTLTVTDLDNSSATCSASVSVTDTAAPVFDVAPSDTSFECDGSGNSAQINAWLASAAASDACTAVSVSHDFTGLTGACGATGTATVTWTATDACGNTATHSATVTVVDTTPPAFANPPNDLTIECDGASYQAQITAWLNGVGANDACGTVTVTNDYDGLVGGCGATGSALVTFTATDACGNTASTTATVAVADTTPPTVTVPATNMVVECDGFGNAAELDDWLANNAGAAATDACGSVSWTHSSPGLSDLCGETGVATVTFSAVDSCGNTATTTASFTIQDTTAPTWLVAPPDVTFPSDGAGNTQDIQEWLDSATADDACGAVTLSNDFAGLTGNGITGAATVTFTAVDDCGNATQHAATVTVVPQIGNSQTSQKGSVLIWPNVEIRWDAAGNVIQETFLEISNDYPQAVRVWVAFVNGDPPLPANPNTGERAHPGWNSADNTIVLTHNQPTYWASLTGEPAGLLPFTALDPGTPPGRPDPENPQERMLRGFVVAWAVDADGHEIRWNHLFGSATLVHYPHQTAWEYQATAFQTYAAEHGAEPLDCTQFDAGGNCISSSLVPGQLGLDGFQYNLPPNKLIFNFLVPDTDAFSGAGHTVTHATDVTLHLVDQDLRQDTAGPVTTKAEVIIWNQEELVFGGLTRCITCWDQVLLENFGSGFAWANLQTNAGRARIDGVASTQCPGSDDAALLGLVSRLLTFDGGAGHALVGHEMRRAGTQSATILYDVPQPTP